MEETKACCCKSFPKALWWLLTLLGIPLLYFFMFNLNKDLIETDLSQRVMASLADEQMDWVKVDIDERGRDVLLSGQAYDDDAKTKAIALAQSVKGVRIVEGSFDDFVPTEDMAFDINVTDGKINLSGAVSSQADVDALVKAAASRVGEENVVNNLVISKDVKESKILQNVAGLTALTALVVEGGSLNFTAEALKLSGTVDSKEKQEVLMGKLQSALNSYSSDIPSSTNGLTVVEPEATEAMALNVEFKDGKMTLDGAVASQSEIDAIVKAASDRVGDDNVVNNLTIDKMVKPSGWLDSLSGLMVLVADNGSLVASADGVKLTGTLDSKDKEASSMDKAKELLSSFNIPAINGLSVVESKPKIVVPTEAMTLNADLKDGNIVLNGLVASQSEVDTIVKAASDRVGDDNVVNNLTIDKKVKPSGWLKNISDLIALMTDDGSLTSTNDGIKLTGEVDSKDQETILLNKSHKLLASYNLPIINGLTIVESKSEPVTETKSEAQAINICQGKFDKAMTGKSIHFSTNRAIIKKSSYPLLKEIVTVISECQNEMSGGISINGHTDSRGEDSYNMALSLRRARAVKNYLEKNKVKPSLLKSVGHGETTPIASNDTREGRAQNRRITFIINK